MLVKAPMIQERN